MAERPAGRTRGLSPHRFRRIIQLLFLLLFLVLLTLTVWPLGTVFLGGFLLADPLLSVNSLANGLVKWELLLALPVLLSPLFIGRAFCGYACPLGLLVELFGPRRERHPGIRARKILRRVPLFTLVTVVFLILMGSAVFLVFDPLSLFTRTVTTLVYPAVDRGLRLAGDLLYHIPAFRGPVDSVTTFLTGRLVFTNGLAFKLQVAILVMFIAILGVSYVERRLWCRHLCPLGAALGLVGRGALFGRRVDEAKCSGCEACVAACPMDAIRDGGRSTDCSRCEGGLECKDACPRGAVSWGYKPRKQYVYDPSRRALLKGAGFAFIGSFFLFSGLSRIQRSPSLVRPPGARAELDFLSTCARCGQCMKICPTNVIQPAVFEAGLEGMFTPSLDFRHGYCNFECNECGKVCPPQAIQLLNLETKQRTIIGRAYIDRSVCIPWSEGRNCLVCQELCPVPQKAIIYANGNTVAQGGKAVTTPPQGAGVPPGTSQSGAASGNAADATLAGDSAAQPQLVKLPYVVPELCIGCGVCQYNCPVPVDAAIKVRAVQSSDPLSK
jgi:polyferredoxin